MIFLRRTVVTFPATCYKACPMNITKLLTATAFALALLAGPSFAADSHAKCCVKAKEAGKECEHPCCVEAKKDGKDCAKCNKPKEAK